VSLPFVRGGAGGEPGFASDGAVATTGLVQS
jgi:hypothetical protein